MSRAVMPQVTFVDLNQKSNLNIIRLAIHPPEHLTQSTPTLYCLDVTKPLPDTVRDIAALFNIQNPTEYGIQYKDSKRYITEKTKETVNNGDILKLTVSPDKAAKEIYVGLKSESPETIRQMLEKLASSSGDVTFAAEFISQNGVDLLVKMIEIGNENGRPLVCILSAFYDLMENNLLDYDTLTPKFIKRVAMFTSRSEKTDAEVIKTALSVLEIIILNSVTQYNLVANEVTFSTLCPHLDSKVTIIQLNCLALMNALCMKAPPEKHERFEASLTSKEIRTVINEKVVRAPAIGTEMSHHLYVFQQLTFNLLDKRMKAKVDLNNERVQEMILDLRKNAFEATSESKRQVLFADDYKKLGFANPQNPGMDFAEVPPGLLALECMSYFSNSHTENYAQVVHENLSRGTEHQCPFAKSSIALTKTLCEILSVGELPMETKQEYHPMFFSTDKAFEEFFCWCIKLFNKTWKEMRATLEDFKKVMSVVKEQIDLSLGSDPKPTTMDQFWNALQTRYTYTHIVKLRQQARWNKEEGNSQARPVLELREQIKPEIQELIKQQRLNYLVAGTRFNRLRQAGKLSDRFWYCRLSPNYKTLHYGTSKNILTPTIESLTDKISVSDIDDMRTGKECTHVKSKSSLAFQIVSGNQPSLGFVASSQEVFDMWTDGINILLNKDPVSKQASTDLDTLLGMEMKIRLLDTANIPIPAEPPDIPPPPPDYNFYYES
ncbi:putative engulfment and cell motility protein 1 [Apostichopus japonicus]|uniref:Putative engulfment and cell motility protein 1 n=1 Tax=Stichopus japonicus TaxID=307972 RepID=A0A2G8KH45_STIJA|nr:putative engulfment and cell motility protein 1 [Apostichopus japonicus]